MHVGRRIPRFDVDAVEDAAEHAGAAIQHVAQSHAAFVRENFFGIRRRHRRDAIGQLYARLEEADSALGLDAVARERMRRQAKQGENLARKLALEREVVDRHQVRGCGRPA